MKIVHAFDDVRSVSDGRVGLVPTMGFLHEGHLSLIEAAKSQNETVVVSVFVNPLQFNEDSDLDEYPRDLDRDALLCETAGADVVFAPDVSHMYPSKQRATVTGKVRIDPATLPGWRRSWRSCLRGCARTTPTSGGRTLSSLPS